ncbi:hypothetical protein J1N09_13930 [Aureitalea sp. L0-47]|uniref:hypothetical protein n=1 Tax=Aureitalea sp. L0-47 TaxID=2816962 RepID=UPI0022370E40|nr:hypothetical protein [Aureitalea sp. L0-47]MCW5520944.1 hypothetical protein [Aureitalea sp. L0-47]
MKSVKIILILAAVMVMGTTHAQKERKEGSPWIIIESIKKEASWNSAFKQKAIALAKLGEHLPPKGLLQFEIQMAKKTIMEYEKAVLNGAGKNLILPKSVKNARKTHPGTEKPALSSRLRMHLMQMERVFEDDE